MRNRGAAGLGQGLCPKRVLPVYSFEWPGENYWQKEASESTGHLSLVFRPRAVMFLLLFRNTCTCPYATISM